MCFWDTRQFRHEPYCMLLLQVTNLYNRAPELRTEEGELLDRIGDTFIITGDVYCNQHTNIAARSAAGCAIQVRCTLRWHGVQLIKYRHGLLLARRLYHSLALNCICHTCILDLDHKSSLAWVATRPPGLTALPAGMCVCCPS
jgi:hypothetical protein